MCFGNNQPQQPQIVYQGPSEADINANQQALDDYAADLTASQKSFQDELQVKIDAANAATADLEARFADDIADANAAASEAVSGATTAADATVAGANTAATTAVDGATGQAAADVSQASASAQQQYQQAITTTSQQTDPELPQTTKSNKDKKKDPKKTLKINTGGAKAQSGAGVNLGI